MLSALIRREFPLVLALALVGTILGTLLVGYEPVGGDPDRLYRPLKTELKRALEGGRLPFWSDRFGLGVALVGESHVAAFYPPNLVLYRLLDVPTAYRLSMWLHYLMLVATTYAYARCLGVATWGAALAAVSFTLCGFQAIHSTHEPFYLLMPYLPLSLLFAERFMTDGRFSWLALVAISLGLQWTLGHFQLQTWTGGLVVVTALWRARVDRKPALRALLLIAAVCWGMALAAVQLGLSWEMAQFVGQTNRTLSALSFYSYPPLHWFELAFPRPLRGLRLGPEDPYWYGQETTGDEAALYVGTIAFVFAVIGVVGKPPSRAIALWCVGAPVSLAVATMPRWWPQGYIYLLSVPPLGYFRVPARYTVITSLGLAILAGHGFDMAITKRRFIAGIVTAIAVGSMAAAAAFVWVARPDVHLRPSRFAGYDGLVWGGVAWLVALGLVVCWRARRLGSAALVVALAAELGILYYNGTTVWGWAIALPRDSPVLSRLAALPNARLIGGELSNLPIRIDRGTGAPYQGFAHTFPNRMFVIWENLLYHDRAAMLSNTIDPKIRNRWLRRCQVTHLVAHGTIPPAVGRILGSWRDDALAQLAYHPPDEAPPRDWSIVELAEPFPEVRAVPRARTIVDRANLINRLSATDDPDVTFFLARDRVPVRPDARSARVVSWDGSVATVEHDGACDLVVARTFYPGWLARIDGGKEEPVISADGGFVAVRVEGSGVHRVRLRFQPTGFELLAWISIAAGALAVATLAAGAWLAISRRAGVPDARRFMG